MNEHINKITELLNSRYSPVRFEKYTSKITYPSSLITISFKKLCSDCLKKEYSNCTRTSCENNKNGICTNEFKIECDIYSKQDCSNYVEEDCSNIIDIQVEDSEIQVINTLFEQYHKIKIPF